MAEHASAWISNALRTDTVNRPELTRAIKDLYAVSKRDEPIVVIVPSPRIMAFAGGFAAAIWHLQGNKRSNATWTATGAATWDATGAATRDATVNCGKPFHQIARDILGEHATLGLSCAVSWINYYQPGNMSSSYDAYLTAARDILGLKLEQHKAYEAWERCAKLGGFRLMHEKFCMVSDFPERLKQDDRHRPHCEDGPSHRWRDGWELWYIHGVAVTEQIVMHPETLTAEQIDAETNAEVRRVMIERFGRARYVRESGAQLVHSLPDNYFIKGLQGAKLYRKAREGDEPLLMLSMMNSTAEPDGSIKEYMLQIDPGAYDGLAAHDCHAAMASTYRYENSGKLVFKKPADYRPALES